MKTVLLIHPQIRYCRKNKSWSQMMLAEMVSSDLEGENGLMDMKAHRYGGLGGWRLMSPLSLWSQYWVTITTYLQ